MNKIYIQFIILAFSCWFGCSSPFEEKWHSSLKDKSCGCNEVTSTSIRLDYVASPGYHREMRFNTLEKVFLTWSNGITIVNANTKEVKDVTLPFSDLRDYQLLSSSVDSSDNMVLAGYYYQKGDPSVHYVIYYMDSNLNFTNIIPPNYETKESKIFSTFFFESNIYVVVSISSSGASLPTSSKLLKYDAVGLSLVEDRDTGSVIWDFADPSKDNLVWSCNINTRTDPSRIIFSFDGSNYTYYGPGVAQNGPNASYAIDANNIFIGYYSGVVWQYDSGDWIKHAICREDEAGYSVKEIWASSKDNVFVAGSYDILREQNFAYHYDGKCWTRWFKGDGSRNISHIWGTPDGSAVLTLDDEGDLYRLYVEK